MSDLRDVLLDIRARHGVLTPEVVRDEARDENHPLHHSVGWDLADSVAADRYRLQRAHELIQSVKVKYREADGRNSARFVRQFHAVQSEAGFVYEPAEEIVADPLKRKIVLQTMEREWRTLKTRYSHFAEFAEMVARDLDEGAA